MSNEAAWSGQGKGTSLGNRIFIAIIGLFGPLPAYALLCLVSAIYVVVDRNGRAALATFRRHAGLAPAGPLQLWRHYHAFGQLLIDRVSFLSGKAPFTYSCINENRIGELLAEGRGLILLSAHIGSWDIAGNLLKDRLDVRMNAVMLDNERDDLKKVWADVESQRRFRIIPLNPNDPLAVMIPVVNALRAGEIVCFLGDRVFGEALSAKIPFFDAPAKFPVGPFQIAALTGAPILPVFTVKTGLLSYRLEAFDPIRLADCARNERAARIETSMRDYAGILEKMAARYPYQWGNFFDLWR